MTKGPVTTGTPWLTWTTLRTGLPYQDKHITYKGKLDRYYSVLQWKKTSRKVPYFLMDLSFHYSTKFIIIIFLLKIV